MTVFPFRTAARPRSRGAGRAAVLSLAIFAGQAALLAVPFAAGVAHAAPALLDDKKDKAPAKPPAEDPEVKMGREAHEEMLRSGIKLIRDPALVERVERIGKKMAEVANANPIPASYGSSKHVPFEYRFFVVDDPDVNAFCLPGGYIYVHKGLLNYIQSDDELAGVLGHEITHASHHHVAKLQKEQSKLNTQMALGLLTAILARVPTADTVNLMTGMQLVAIQKVNGYGQNAERDADHAGVILAQKAGYNPVGALTFMERLARDQKMRPDIEMGIFRTHPPEAERADAMIAEIKGMGLPINRRDVTNALKIQVRSVSGTREGSTAAAAPAPAAPAPAAPPAPAPGEVQTVAGLSEVLIDGQVLYRTASADRAKQFADRLDQILDQDIQIYDISRRGSSVLIRGKELLSVAPEDVALALTGNPPAPAGTAVPTAPADAVADQTYRVLRNALFKQFIQNAY